MKAADVKRALAEHVNPEKAAFYPRFFKAGPGQYAEGDRFLGVVVPDQRRVARTFRELGLSQIRILLASAFHEHRLTALLILAEQVQRADAARRKTIFEFVVRNVDRVNNWDLVDLAGPALIGPHLVTQPDARGLLDEFAASDSLWRRRIAVVSTLAFIREGDFRHTLRLCRRLLNDDHDLIHKATGWMLRELGKRDESPLRRFLDRNAPRMPRTMLRYAIEKLPERVRKHYMEAGG